jgi:peptide/nickel transport system ATP-binding protein
VRQQGPNRPASRAAPAPLTRSQHLQRERGFACLFVSHDLGAVARIADRIAVMQPGRIIEEGPRDAILDAPQHPYTRALLEAAPRLEVLPA